MNTGYPTPRKQRAIAELREAQDAENTRAAAEGRPPHSFWLDDCGDVFAAMRDLDDFQMLYEREKTKLAAQQSK